MVLRTPRLTLLFACAVALSTTSNIACDRVYYKAMKKFGVEKRDILVKRVRDARKSQAEAKEEFKTALERFKDLVDVEGGKLEEKDETLAGAQRGQGPAGEGSHQQRPRRLERPFQGMAEGAWEVF
jgi:Protein of unknown function (DUF2959)